MPISFAVRGILTPSPAPDIVTGLIHYWPMNDANGVNDIGSATHLNGTITGGISSVAGPGGLLTTARGTDGTGTINYGTGAFDWSSANPFTVAGWVKYGNVLVSTGGAERQRVWSDDTTGTDAVHNLDCFLDHPNTRFEASECNRGRCIAGSGSVVAGVWNHWALACVGPGGSGALTYWWNGVRQLTPFTPGGGGFWGSVQANFLTGDLAGNGIMNAGGAICGHRLYNRVLGDVDVMKLFTDIT